MPETCAFPLWLAETAVRCVRPLGHRDGHVYHSSQPVDRHDLTEPHGHKEG